jgi:ornithine cyclodeaminase
MTVADAAVECLHDSVLACVGDTPMVRLNRLFPQPGIEVIAKLEFMNPGGSMKDRPARYIVEAGLADGSIPRGAHLVESSSGNFGIALAIAARLHGLMFTCVVDPKTTAANLAILHRLGVAVDVVSEPDDAGGYLQTRIRRVQELLQQIPAAVWINQYASHRNWEAYYHGTGAEICKQLVRPPDYLFAAVSTTGSILGCSRRLRERFAELRVVAVDATGSIIFGGRPGRRDIPGIGASRVPELLQRSEIDDVVHVSDLEAAHACRTLLEAEGIFAGGSSGSVVAAIAKALPDLRRPCRIVTIFPDRGDRYLDLMYDDNWLAERQRRSARPTAGPTTRRTVSSATELTPAGPRILYLSRRDVVAVGGDHSDLYLPALRRALVAHADGKVVQPLKPYLRVPGGAGHIADRIIAMPGYLADPGVCGIKWIGSKHDNPSRVGLARASGVIVLNDPRTNYPIALLEAGLISAWRTAAVTCLAAAQLARKGFTDVALVGCGVIGRTQLRALLQQFDHIAALHLYDLNPATAQELAHDIAAEYPAVTSRVAACAEDVVRVGDVVIPCTVTDQPYIPFRWLKRGAFVSNVSIMDVHKDVFLHADKVVVDDWEQSNREKKIINQLVLEGSFSRERLHAELGAVLAGQRPGRESDDEIIVLNPMGMAVEDIACAAEVYTRACRRQIGTWLDLY